MGKIVGITGTNGAGKGTVVDCLIACYGAKHFSVSALIIEKGKEMGIPPGDRSEITKLANSLRLEYGQDYFIRILGDRAVEKGGWVSIIESLRCPGEINSLAERFGNDFLLVGVDAPTEVRYNRILKRGDAVKDKCITFEDFQCQEMEEMGNSDPFKQNLLTCAKMVPLSSRIWNDGAIEDLYSRVDEIIRGSV